MFHRRSLPAGLESLSTMSMTNDFFPVVRLPDVVICRRPSRGSPEETCRCSGSCHPSQGWSHARPSHRRVRRRPATPRPAGGHAPDSAGTHRHSRSTAPARRPASPTRPPGHPRRSDRPPGRYPRQRHRPGPQPARHQQEHHRRRPRQTQTPRRPRPRCRGQRRTLSRASKPAGDSSAEAAVNAARPSAEATKTANRNTPASVRHQPPRPQRAFAAVSPACGRSAAGTPSP